MSILRRPQAVRKVDRGALFASPAPSEVRFSQTRPAQHAENQYEGLFKGQGAQVAADFAAIPR